MGPERMSTDERSWREWWGRMADQLTRWSASFPFFLVHVLWFAAWLAYNLLARQPFDEYPFGLLTLIVSLEAIFLSMLVLISQNRTTQRDEERAVDDFRTNLRSEVLLEMIGEKVGIDTDEADRRARKQLTSAHHDDPVHPDR